MTAPATDAIDETIAELLRAGTIHRLIRAQLKVGEARIRRVRDERSIPKLRGRRTRAEIDALEPKIIAMLRDGDTIAEIYRQTRFSLNGIARLRLASGLRVPIRPRKRRSVAEAFAHYAQPAEDGHLLWTGSRSGRSLDLLAEGRTFNARAVAFEKHHGRVHEGRLWRTCQIKTCIAGAHHTDSLIRYPYKDTAHGH
jgi:hypothetical protein